MLRVNIFMKVIRPAYRADIYGEKSRHDNRYCCIVFPVQRLSETKRSQLGFNKGNTTMKYAIQTFDCGSDWDYSGEADDGKRLLFDTKQEAQEALDSFFYVAIAGFEDDWRSNLDPANYRVSEYHPSYDDLSDLTCPMEFVKRSIKNA
tara:strand:- start:228 stop:671 length:444 start_codon:yes stop_codon:yes gene_type:complete